MHPPSFAVQSYIRECNLMVEKCNESIERQKQGIFALLYYQIFRNSCDKPNFCKKHIKSQHHVFMQQCFFQAPALKIKELTSNLWKIYLLWLSFWLNCCGFIMVRGLHQHTSHFYFQIYCISNIKSKCRTCFSFLTYYILRALQMKIAM